MSARDDYDELTVGAWRGDVALAEQADAALNEIDWLRRLVADLCDRNGCSLIQDGDPQDGPTCVEHNWSSVEHDGRECPHASARRWLRKREAMT